MSRVFCLMNHSLTQKQIAELTDVYKCKEIVYPDETVSSLWSQVNSTNEKDVIQSVIFWLKAAKDGDYLIIQGEFGLTFTLVDYALKEKLIPIYATSKRIAKESRVGETVHREYIFEHICFKKYEYFKEL